MDYQHTTFIVLLGIALFRVRNSPFTALLRSDGTTRVEKDLDELTKLPVPAGNTTFTSVDVRASRYKASATGNSPVRSMDWCLGVNSAYGQEEKFS